jgi:hypothetical protein
MSAAPQDPDKKSLTTLIRYALKKKGNDISITSFKVVGICNNRLSNPI